MNVAKTAHIIVTGLSRSGDAAGLTCAWPFVAPDEGGGEPALVVAPAALSPNSLEFVRGAGGDGHAGIMLPGRLGGSLVRSISRANSWKPVELPQQSERLARVWLPAEIIDAIRIIAVNEVQHRGSRPLLILGLWAQFAHPRQRLGAMLSSHRESLAVEIAMAVIPEVNVLIFKFGTRQFAVLADDQVAAELAGLAVLDLLHPGSDKMSPWQDPLVQRATELRFGVNQPDQIALETASELGPPGDDEQFLVSLTAGIRMRLGLSQPVFEPNMSRVYSPGDEFPST